MGLGKRYKLANGGFSCPSCDCLSSYMYTCTCASGNSTETSITVAAAAAAAAINTFAHFSSLPALS